MKYFYLLKKSINCHSNVTDQNSIIAAIKIFDKMLLCLIILLLLPINSFGACIPKGENLIINGDFTNGNVSFRSDYIVKDSNTNHQQYSITNDVKSFNLDWEDCTEHTGNNGLMMVINGSGNHGAIIWEQNINVNKNVLYKISLWAASASPGNPALLRFYCNNEPNEFQLNLFSLTCYWQEYTIYWNSNTNDKLNLKIREERNALGGNDFIIDDISMFECGCDTDTDLYIQAFPGKKICKGDSVLLQPSVINNDFKYEWSTGDTIPSIWVKENGKYSLRASQTIGCIYSDTIDIEVVEFSTKIEGSKEFCENDSTILKAYPEGNSYKYLWSTGEKSQSIIVKKGGIYSVKVTYENLCSNSSEILITEIPKPKVKIIRDTDTIFKIGDSIILKASPVGFGFLYEWSKGEISSSIAVNKAGLYVLKITNSNGCYNYDSVRIYEKIIEVKIIGEQKFCYGDSVLLSVTPFDSKYKYIWSSGDTTPNIFISKAGIYIVYMVIKKDLQFSDTIAIDYYPQPTAKIGLNNDPCVGEVTEIFSEFNNEGDRFLWSTGDTTSRIKIEKSGIYYLTVINKFGCKSKDSVEIYEKPKVSIIGEKYICLGYPIIIKTDSEFNNYLWSSGETSREIIVNHGGVFRVTVTNKHGCNAEADFEVKEKYIEVSGFKSVNFDSVCTGETVNYIFNLKNVRPDTIKIQSVLTKNQSGEFEYSFPNYIAAGKEVEVSVSFKPMEIGNYNDTIIVKLKNLCDSLVEIPLSGYGIIKTLIMLPDTIAEINSEIRIPLTIQLTCGLSIPETTEFKSEIKYDKSAILPIENQESGVTDGGILDNDRIIFINSNNHKIGISGLVLLPVKDTIPLKWENFNWTNSLIESERLDGRLIVKGVCVRNLSRIKYYNPLQVQIKSNMSEDKAIVSISGDEKGAGIIAIYTIEGLEINSINFNKAQNSISKNINLSQFANGFYLITVRINNKIITKSIAIIK